MAGVMKGWIHVLEHTEYFQIFSKLPKNNTCQENLRGSALIPKLDGDLCYTLQ